jgi:hypothetical protein
LDDAKISPVTLGKAGLTTGIIMILVLHDVTWEDGRWASFPPAPWFMMMMARNLLFHVHSDYWKFAPCDAYGRPKAQYARPPK